jgi:hypothetical protein
MRRLNFNFRTAAVAPPHPLPQRYPTPLEPHPHVVWEAGEPQGHALEDVQPYAEAVAVRPAMARAVGRVEARKDILEGLRGRGHGQNTHTHAAARGHPGCL